MSTETAPRRQARGLARMEGILDAAGELLADEGSDGLTMNAVARRAGISPGSLYQFFSDREAMLAALAERYAGGLARSMPPPIDAEVVRSGALAELIDAALDPVLGFFLREPGCRACFRGDGAELQRIMQPVHDAVIDRVLELIRVRAPQLTSDEARRTARMIDLIVSGTAPAIIDAHGAERRRLTDETKTVLLRYLQPIDRAVS